MKWFRLVSIVFLMLAMLLLASPFAYADDPPDDDLVIYISISGDPKVDNGGACKVNIRGEGSSEINTVMFLSPDWVTHSNGSNHAVIQVTNDAFIDVTVREELSVDIAASGACKLNVRVEGPWEVHIDAGDEVRLNVEAGDESQVFVDDSLDNPAQTDDPSATYQESQDVDEHSSRLDELAIISGVFPAAGLFVFFLIRRKAKVNSEEVRK